MRLALTGKGEQILHDAMRSLCLLEQFGDEICRSFAQVLRFQQLRIAQNCSERIVQFVRNSGNQLADGGHLFALQQLLLSASQVVIGAAGLLVQPDLLNGGGQLPADCNQQVFVICAVFAVFAAADSHDAHRLVFTPKEYPYPRAKIVRTNKISNAGRQVREVFGCDHFRARACYKFSEAFNKPDLGNSSTVRVSLTPNSAAAESDVVFFRKVD